MQRNTCHIRYFEPKVNSHGTEFLSIHHSPYQNFYGCLIVPSFPHTLCAYQHVSLFGVSISEAELKPQLHVLLHFPWHNDLIQDHLCFCCMDSDSYSSCCMWISLSPTSDWKVLLWRQWDLHCVRAAGCFSALTLRWFNKQVFLKAQVNF